MISISADPTNPATISWKLCPQHMRELRQNVDVKTSRPEDAYLLDGIRIYNDAMECDLCIRKNNPR